MKEYEIFFLVGESKKIELENVKKNVEATIVSEGGEMLPGEFFDERRTEFPIRGERRGSYIAKRFTVKEDAGDVPGAITKQLSFNRDVLRSIIVQAEKLPTLEESQDRVKRNSEIRKRTNSRYQQNQPIRAKTASDQPTVSKDASDRPALTDVEIDKKLEEVLDL